MAVLMEITPEVVWMIDDVIILTVSSLSLFFVKLSEQESCEG